jgi:hypothetical protein
MGFGVDALLDRDEAIRLGHEAALEGGPEAVREVVLEALRFQPSAPALERICARETRIAGRRVRRGDQVMALVGSAMMDSARVADPRRFVPGRGDEANLHFGDRLHRCIGQHISMAQIGAISSVLLAHESVARAGSLERTGPYPSRLLVSFGRGAGVSDGRGRLRPRCKVAAGSLQGPSRKLRPCECKPHLQLRRPRPDRARASLARHPRPLAPRSAAIPRRSRTSCAPRPLATQTRGRRSSIATAAGCASSRGRTG